MPRLKVLILLSLFLPLLACTEGKPPQSQDWKAATGAEAYERLWWKAIQDGDFKTAQWRLASIYTLTTASGIRDREQAIQYFQGLNLSSISLGELEVKPHGVDMVVSYVATVQSKSSPNPQRFYMTTVWQEAKRGWMAIAHSEVPAGTTGGSKADAIGSMQ
jgi:Domain of unknown function (DUF4440)